MSDRPYNVLFLCTGNSARSILAEALLNRWGRGKFRAYSAGSFPKGQVHPLALALLKHKGFTVDGLRSKSWNEFSGPNAPHLDFIFTVCDNAAGEVCPIWPGHPLDAHWGIADPAAATGTDEERRHAFDVAFRELEMRIQLFCSLSLHALDRTIIKDELVAIGKLPGATRV